MPDFTYEVFYHCVSAEHFTKEVEGSKGKKYIVRYDTVHRGPYEYDYTCNCESFKYRKHCRVKESGEHCNWLQFIEGSQPVEKDGKKVCPKCGKEVNTQRWAV